HWGEGGAKRRVRVPPTIDKPHAARHNRGMTFLRGFKVPFIILLSGIACVAVPPRAGAAGPAADSGRPPILGIAHVALLTSDLSAARHFYGSVLGFDEAFDVKLPVSHLDVCFFKVNDHQYIEVYSEPTGPNEDSLLNIAFETTDAAAMRAYLARRGVHDMGNLEHFQDGDLGFSVTDPNAHDIQFVQYLPGSMTGRRKGQHLSPRRVSTEIIHAGLIVQNRAADDAFYKNILGFSVMWYGGKKDGETDWVDMRVPDGTNWLEYMLNVQDFSRRTLGVNHHLALGVPSIATAAKTVSARGYKPVKPQIGRDGKWQLNLYDPDRTRVELMEPKPVRTPCCSPMHLP
ncbi:MAG: VOC family protein, partial [Terriglobia bacterium]